MILVACAILLVVLAFILCAVLVASLSGKQPQPNHRLLHKRYSYRADPHADQTTVSPNRLRDNEISDVPQGDPLPPRDKPLPT